MEDRGVQGEFRIRDLVPIALREDKELIIGDHLRGKDRHPSDGQGVWENDTLRPHKSLLLNQATDRENRDIEHGKETQGAPR